MTLTKGPSNTFYPAQVDASKNKLIISCQQLQNMASTQDASASGGDEFGPQGPDMLLCRNIGECGGIFNLDGHAQIKKCPNTSGFFHASVVSLAWPLHKI